MKHPEGMGVGGPRSSAANSLACHSQVAACWEVTTPEAAMCGWALMQRAGRPEILLHKA